MIMATTPNSTAQSRFFVNFMDFSDTLFPHPLSIAAYNGHVDIVTRIVDWSIEFGMDLFNSIFMETPMAFQSFMGFNGSIQTAENLETAVPEADRLAILHQFGRIVTIEADKALLVSKRDFSVFQEACQSGYSTIVSELYNEWVLDEAARVAMVSSHNYGNFVGAADAGSTLVLNLLYNWLPEASRSVIFTTPANRVCGHYSAFNRAASKGHLEGKLLSLLKQKIGS